MQQHTMPSVHLSSNFIIFIIIPTILLIFTIFIIFYLIHRLRRLPTTIPLLYNSHRFSYNHLLAATNSFSPHYGIGKGSSATVYRGVLTNGDSVAVKLIHASSSSSAHLQFHNELSILSALTSPYIVSLLGYCIRNDDLILVYEYMPNRSLQEALFDADDRSGSESDLSWDHRFRIVKDVANALAYLHLECHPPVIHGDLKPSNVLLDIDFRARVSDFGLSRVKDDEQGPPHPLSSFSQELSGNVAPPAGSSSHLSCNEADSAKPPQASATVRSEYNENGGEEDLEQGRQWGKDWWWRQDGSGELCTKDYVTEWIGSQICSATDNRDWDDDQDGEKSASPPVFQLQVPELPLADKEGENWTRRHDKKKTHRKLHEWWGDDHHPDISKTRIKLRKLEKKWSKSFKKPILTFSRSFKLRRRRKFGQHDASNCHIASDFSLTKGWKKNKEEAHAHPGCSEIWSGDLFSRELSSTTSMRGTLCYVAPECGGGCGGYLMEKADIYSLGVLILVIVSGRRPLHVLSSPMKFEKANLVSWCRHLAQNGNVLELVDKRLKQRGYSKEQAALCINLALSCLQKMPELRPDIGDVVKILNGEMDMLAVPFEFSPSPPSRLLSRSRSQQKANGA